MRKIEKQIVDIICGGTLYIGEKRLSSRDRIVRDDDGRYHVFLHDTEIALVMPWSRKMRITMHGYGTPTTMSRIRALLEGFHSDFYLTRDPKQRYDEYSEWTGKYKSRGEPLLISPAGQMAHIRDTEVLVLSDKVKFWDTKHLIWEDYPAVL